MIRRRFYQQGVIFDKNNYLTIHALTDDFTFTFSKELEYNINGDGWNVLAANEELPYLKSGDFVSLRAELQPVQNAGIGQFTIPADRLCNLSGNCMSLLFGDKANNKNSLKGYSYAFYSLFLGPSNSIKKISRNFLPATELSVNCYDKMFYGCTSLQTAPELPATTLADYCYESMFRGCTSLNYIKMLATDISAYNCLYYWVYDVASSGTFVKNVNMNDLPTATVSNSYRGIPNGWTVITDEEESEK